MIENVNGDHIVVIQIPRADRTYKPVYVDGNPLNTFRSNGEGDYKCTSEELRAMYRDASVKTQDMLVLQDMGMDVFNADSLRGYRQRMRLSRPGHVWDTLEDEDKLQLDLKVPFEMEGPFRVDDTPVHQAVREALANCLVNADYYGRGGLVIIKRRGEITMSNPGNFRIELAAAKAGGLSDPRNGTMLKMFNMIDIGERAGSGIPNIFRVWHDQGWVEPTITQRMNPDRITLSLVLSPTSTDKSAIKIGDKSNSAIKSAKRQMIIEYLTDHSAAKSAEIAEYVDLKPSRVRDYLAELIAEEIVVAEGGNRNRTYRLKA